MAAFRNHLALILLTLMLFGLSIFDADQKHKEVRAAAQQSATLAPVYVEAIDWLNVRYGPDAHSPRIGLIEKGTQYAVVRRTASSDWLEIAFPQFAGGWGWVYRAAVTVMGSLNDVPIADEHAPSAGYPTLTSTPAVV